jgi:hypothetical protein
MAGAGAAAATTTAAQQQQQQHWSDGSTSTSSGMTLRARRREHADNGGRAHMRNPGDSGNNSGSSGSGSRIGGRSSSSRSHPPQALPLFLFYCFYTQPHETEAWRLGFIDIFISIYIFEQNMKYLD